MKLIDKDTREEQLKVYKAYKHVLSRCKNARVIEYIMIKIEVLDDDQIFFMFWSVLNEDDNMKFLEELDPLLENEFYFYNIRTSTTEGDVITIRNQEDFYCALILYLNECSGTDLEKPMTITIALIQE